MSEFRLRIATRSSALAMWQAEWVKSQLASLHPGLGVDLLPIKTRGDKILDLPLARVGGKGLFVKELEEAILAGEADIAVHSLKDIPSEFPPGLGLGPILEREDPRDAFLSMTCSRVADLPVGARVGSSSLRRQSQLLHRRPDLQIIPLRGNVNTRIAKLEAGQFDAIILAAAGVKRLGLTQRVMAYLEPHEMLPAVGQGAVALEWRLHDPRIVELVAPLDHSPTRIRVLGERAFLARLEGGCQVPLAAHGVLAGDELTLHGLVADPAGHTILQHTVVGLAGEAEILGRQLAEILLTMGAATILGAVYASTNPGPLAAE